MHGKGTKLVINIYLQTRPAHRRIWDGHGPDQLFNFVHLCGPPNPHILNETISMSIPVHYSVRAAQRATRFARFYQILSCFFIKPIN